MYYVMKPVTTATKAVNRQTDRQTIMFLTRAINCKTPASNTTGKGNNFNRIPCHDLRNLYYYSCRIQRQKGKTEESEQLLIYRLVAEYSAADRVTQTRRNDRYMNSQALSTSCPHCVFPRIPLVSPLIALRPLPLRLGSHPASPRDTSKPTPNALNN